MPRTRSFRWKTCKKRLNLCEQAEELQDSTDWKEATGDLIQPAKDWKEIGSVPRKYSDKIWKRFRKACDHFFNRKSEHFAECPAHMMIILRDKEAAY